MALTPWERNRLQDAVENSRHLWVQTPGKRVLQMCMEHRDELLALTETLRKDVTNAEIAAHRSERKHTEYRDMLSEAHKLIWKLRHPWRSLWRDVQTQWRNRTWLTKKP